MNPANQASSTAPRNAWLEPHPRLDGVAPIDHLFNKFDGLYPHRFRSAFSGEIAIKNWRDSWAEGMIEEWITRAEMGNGLKACRTKFLWPPSFAEFISACRPPVDFEAAFVEAVEQMRNRENGEDSWSHPAIYWACASIGDFDMRNTSWKSIKNRWTAVLSGELSKGEWQEIPPKAIALPPPKFTAEDQENSRKRVSEASAMLKYQASTDWAKRLRDRYLSGEKLLHVQITLASEALGEVWRDGKVVA